MSKLDWDKADRREMPKERRKRKRKRKPVHPNSMAARKWGAKTWRTQAED